MRNGQRRKPWSSEPYRDETSEARAARAKIYAFSAVVFLVFGILTLQLARLQLIDGEEYRLRAETNRLRQVPILPARGLIYDRNGVPLVANRPGYAAAVVAADVPRERQGEIAIALQELTGVPAAEVSRTVDERRLSNDPFTPAVIKDGLSTEQAFLLRERLAALPGVRVVVQPRREYTQGELMSHILGFVGAIDSDEYAELAGKGYLLNDRLGKAGVELTYESLLRGTPGTRFVEADASGREIQVIQELPAKPGLNLVLSIDLELQRKVAEVLRGAMGGSRNAAAGVIDVRTGEILALVSLPGYDNNIFTSRVDEAQLQRLLNDPAKPLLDHSIGEMFPPGSTFKQVTGIAALQEGIANANTTIFSPGVIYVQNQYVPTERIPFRDWAPLGSLNFYRGVAMSSDVYFYYLAGGYYENGRELFQGLGATRLAEWARRFGLGSRTGIDLPGETPGFVPDPAWKQSALAEVWTLGDTYNFGIGQGYLATTPLQMLVVTAAVANGGDVLVPHVVKEARDGEGKVVPIERQTVRRNINVDPRNLNVMREGMRQAVVDGTAKAAAVANVQVAGKTGTAEVGQRRADGSYRESGWFTGYAPFNNPQVAIVVYLEQGGGASTAAPAAGKILDYYFNGRATTQRPPP